MGLTKQHWIVIAAVAAVAVYLVVDRLVVTEKERVERAVEGLRDSVARADLRAFGEMISPGYGDESFSAEALLGAAAKFFERHGPLALTVRDMRVTVSGPSAAARASVTARSEHGYWGRSEWQADFRKERDGQWRVVRLTPLRFGGKEAGGWGDVLRGAGL